MRLSLRGLCRNGQSHAWIQCVAHIQSCEKSIARCRVLYTTIRNPKRFSFQLLRDIVQNLGVGVPRSQLVLSRTHFALGGGSRVSSTEKVASFVLLYESSSILEVETWMLGHSPKCCNKASRFRLRQCFPVSQHPSGVGCEYPRTCVC